ncbi:2-C-methyl-D-erythritol 4-phosphate cytidylyltransferase [Kitasatospora sp. MMS16-BH015]|uniref:2-C-methyl-D-erythritol 4-phosphate cytidylyltransferase n=1 Tax=Kitasatospora sp. MMS16-BH015 TaxID=2018025 RepID=UPI000CA160B4|nr:2-C-methyl-D-erythritol 4-phosphate cytidylyltransferase [Kitasatospora sp. MMS16-BH015]AUG78060.1 2-C-methyl-D-erythritol 4-phosphate cytidylyltransferase [Kitasatospora sp. MMS16-BH015]
MAIPTSPKERNLNASAAVAAAVVPAAGRGERLGPGAPKALRELGGVPLLVHAVRALARSRAVGLVVVAAPADGVAEVAALLDSHGLDGKDIRVVAGGATRQESVRLGLAAVPAEFEVVLVHDAARPLVPVDVVDAVAAAVRAGAQAVVPGVPLADTVKRVVPQPGAPEPVLDTPDRASLRAVQTPQGFRRATLGEVHEKALVDEAVGTLPPVTDDAGLVEHYGGQVVVVPGHEEAFKVTRPLDLVLAEAVLARRRASDGF